jgi:hypothetical protein
MLERWRITCLAATVVASVLLSGCSPDGPPSPDPRTAPNVVLRVVATGPAASDETYNGRDLLKLKDPGIGLFPDHDLSPASRLLSSYSYNYLTHVPKGDYTAAIFYWSVTPTWSGDMGTVGKVITDGPTAPLTISGSELETNVDLDYNASGNGPYAALGGNIYVTGNAPYGPNQMQVEFIPEQHSPGEAPGEALVQSVTLAAYGVAHTEFSTLLRPGSYMLGFAADSKMRWREDDSYAPVPLTVSSPIDNLQLNLRNNRGPRPETLGQISGELQLGGDWTLGNEPLIVRAQRETTGSMGFHVVHYDYMYDRADWVVMPEDVREDKADFMLGWLADGDYTIYVIKGDKVYERPEQVRVGPIEFVVDGLAIDPTTGG